MEEFTPLDDFSRLFRKWWLIALSVILGGLAAYGFHRVHPQQYEAIATIMATIDLEIFPFQDVREDLIQYNEDMALGTIAGILRSSEVTQELLATAQSQGISLDSNDLARFSSIERKHAIWEVRFRDPDPVVAQQVANLWIQIGYEAMQARQIDGRMAPFVILEPPTMATQPVNPIAYKLSNLLLAGSMAGLIVGVLVTIPFLQRKSIESESRHD